MLMKNIVMNPNNKKIVEIKFERKTVELKKV